MNLERIKQIAFKLMGNKRSHEWKEIGNKYQHGERVANLVLVLRKYILPDDDSHGDILTVAAWFHDVMNGYDNHAEEGSHKAREALTGNCSEQELDEICKIIRIHDDRSSDRSKLTDYIKLHQDADQLDHFGTFDIWMEFSYAMHFDKTMIDVIDWLQNNLRNEGKRYRNELNYDISKKIFDEKVEFVQYFCDRLSVEGTGGIWNEMEIIGNL